MDLLKAKQLETKLNAKNLWQNLKLGKNKNISRALTTLLSFKKQFLELPYC